MTNQVLNSTDGCAAEDERKALVKRILSSHPLQRAARLRELLDDIVSHADNPDDLAEHRIGVRVFGRSEGYNPADDNIVRASVRQLRGKLKEYFESDGAGESVILDIPRGAYVPAFRPRPAVVAVQPSIVFPVTPPVPPAPPVQTQTRQPGLWIGLGLVLAISTVWLAVGRSTPREPPQEPDSVLAQFLRQSPGPVRFVLTDSALAVMRSWRDSPIGVDSYRTRDFVEEGVKDFSGNRAMENAWRDISTRQITSFADVGVLVKLLQSNPSTSRRVEVRHARHMAPRDFKSGNLIITGSQVANPWAALFEDGLNFQIEQHRIVNRAASAGEPNGYEAAEPGGSQWSRIALVRNLSGTGWVLLIAGLGFVGTEGAGEYLLRLDSLTNLRGLMGISPGEPLPPFELVLSTKAVDGTAYSSRIVAWRRH